jgi:hypothetical protein
MVTKKCISDSHGKKTVCLIAPCARWFNCFLGVDKIDTLSVVMYLQQFLKAAWQERNLSQLGIGGHMMLQETTILPPQSQLHLLLLLSLDFSAERKHLD